MLRAIKPEIKKHNRAKILISGPAGSGKTHFAASFKNGYYIDLEEGAIREQYQKLLKKSNSMYVNAEQGITDFQELVNEIRSLATEKHSYKTVTIDSLSHIYNQTAAEAELKTGSAFGADKKVANIPCRQLLRWIDKIDLNVIIICHQKADWSNRDKDGQPNTTYDAYDKVSYSLDLWLELKDNKFVVRKSRLENFREGQVFSRDYETFAEMFGSQDIERDVETIKLATLEEVKLCENLAKGLNMSQGDIDKLFKKVNVESFEEMSHDQIQSCTEFLTKKVEKLKGE